MFAPLLAADPTFRRRWEEFQAEWPNEAEPPLYLALGSLAEHLLERLGRGDTEGFDRVFDVVERWHTQGDAYVSEAASVGLLESLQNQLGGNESQFRRRDGITANDVVPWLRPKSRRWWDKLNRFWDGERGALRLDV
jgi:hypothetical protein